MKMEQWIGLVGALILTGPLIWYLFKDLLTDIEQELKSKGPSSQGSNSDRNIGYFEAYLEQFAGRVKFWYHFAFPFFMFFLFWSVFTIWAEDWIKS